MKVLVTGSSGTIGTRLCERLLANGHEVTGIDWQPCRWLPDVERIRIDADLREDDAFAGAPTDVDVVVHLAANARVYELVEHPDRARDNLLTLWNTLEFVRRNGIGGFLFASSREVYGNTEAERLREDMVRIENCESPYTASKAAGEAFVHAYRRCYGTGAVIFRFSNVYGMYDDSVRVVPQFYRRAKTGEPLLVYGKDKCLDFTYIDDAVQGIIRCLERFDAVEGETFNIACGQGTTILELAKRMKELLGSDSPIEMTSARTGEVIRYVADIAHAREKLGYEPEVPFEQGIGKTVEWYNAHLKNSHGR